MNSFWCWGRIWSTALKCYIATRTFHKTIYKYSKRTRIFEKQIDSHGENFPWFGCCPFLSRTFSIWLFYDTCLKLLCFTSSVPSSFGIHLKDHHLHFNWSERNKRTEPRTFLKSDILKVLCRCCCCLWSLYLVQNKPVNISYMLSLVYGKFPYKSFLNFLFLSKWCLMLVVFFCTFHFSIIIFFLLSLLDNFSWSLFTVWPIDLHVVVVYKNENANNEIYRLCKVLMCERSSCFSIFSKTPNTFLFDWFPNRSRTKIRINEGTPKVLVCKVWKFPSSSD